MGKLARNRLLVPEAESALDRLKMETAKELGLDDEIEEKGWGNMTTREVGKIGGNMVKKMISIAEKEMGRNSSPQ
ncbi:small, acid-soluble spore protein, alpha/beta type [Thermicanus aegyptius]|uniref:small, acid-soluble spore protein, alpha/beta type n=1 Tax=Thermicanus aegyptius TaxID=94009 RepID=UPI003CCB933C